MLKAYLKENKDKIALYYLPAYSPYLNPDEYLNPGMKSMAQVQKVQRKQSAGYQKRQKSICDCSIELLKGY
jgi:hypothetical protein